MKSDTVDKGIYLNEGWYLGIIDVMDILVVVYCDAEQ